MDYENVAKHFQRFKDFRGAQKTSLENGNPNDWDLTLLGTILTSHIFIPFYNKKITKWIRKLMEIRNKWAHCPEMIIKDTDFEKYHSDFCLAMKSLGYKDEEKLYKEYIRFL